MCCANAHPNADGDRDRNAHHDHSANGDHNACCHTYSTANSHTGHP
jgi:hypothetical protein